MTEADFLRLSKRAKAKAKRLGLNKQECEDVAQNVYLMPKSQTIDQFVVDQVRAIRGRSHMPNGYKSPKREALRNTRPLTKLQIDTRFGYTQLDLCEVSESLPKEPMQRAITLLRFYWGLDLKEIGFLFNRCETWVWQISGGAKRDPFKVFKDKK